ncbi:hypothetical protein [Burkholderia ubonensis]|uniref:hypothetical protein n=1 Tax=Burkholderia ubonensis TaxID=101571 RepID=UPI000A9F6207|nr:hypothetical protein [Burkholderia ubonensis]
MIAFKQASEPAKEEGNHAYRDFLFGFAVTLLPITAAVIWAVAANGPVDTLLSAFTQ